MANLIKTKRGLDIPINGKAVEKVETSGLPGEFALIPDYYHGITPKLLVKEGDEVQAGSPVFFDKQFPEMHFVSPVSGRIKSINRGERRKIMSIVIENDGKMTSRAFDKPDLSKQTAGDVILQLQQAGLWAYVKQRPYDVIANPGVLPKAIFVSTFDTAPLAPDNDYVIGGQMADFQKGIDVLAKVARVNLGVKAGGKTPFSSVKNAEITEFDGPHPVGNVGIQINHVNPVNKGEVVWTINPQDVLFIGRFYNRGVVDLSRTIALTGPSVKAPRYYSTVVGAALGSLLQGKLIDGLNRIVMGNVLSGVQTDLQGWLDPYTTQISVLEDGAETHELLGWGMPRFHKYSVSGTFMTGVFENKLIRKIFGNMKYQWDTRLMGGRRAIIMSGEYDKVLPMDLYPEFLFKAMITGNIDKMEALGAYEIAPEDVALCEFVCTSKLPLQQIVRNSLDLMKKELE